jgi:hypothetical protein
VSRKPRRQAAEKKARADDGAGSFETYLEYNRVLRTWFVGFGIGGPALFLVNGDVADGLVAEGQLRLVVILFLTGAGAQVFGALLNKIANWYVYLSEIDDDWSRSRFYGVAEWLAEQFWIDMLLDLLTIGVFGYAAWLLLTVFAS